MSTLALNLPIIITGPGLYLTRGGVTVSICENSHRIATHNHWVGRYENGYYDAWPSHGRHFSHCEDPGDIIARLSNIIDGPGFYMTRSGSIVHITVVEPEAGISCIGYYVEDECKHKFRWPVQGRINGAFGAFPRDIISKCPQGLKPISTYTIS